LAVACTSEPKRPPLLTDTPTLPSDRIPKRTEAFQSAPCWVTPTDEYAVDCGYVTAPAHAESPGGDSVKLAVAVVYSNGASVAADPVVFLDGGPGEASLSDFLGAVPFDSVLEDRDLVLFDQRGTGFSTPKPECDPSDIDVAGPTDAGVAQSDAGVPDEVVAALAACRDRAVADGIDLSIFRSSENAADVTAVREALGYAQWNLYGISYGTRYALTALRDQSKGVRTAIIDSVVPLQADLLSDEGVSFYDDLHRIAAACSVQAPCNENYGDIESKALSALDRIEANPPEVPVDGGITTTLSAELVAAVFQSAMYSALSIAYLPQIIQEIYDEDYSLFVPALSTESSTSALLDRATYFSTVCAEDAPFSSPAAMNARLEAMPEAWRRWFAPTSIFDVCNVWQVPAAPAVEHQPVDSAIPTLVMSGAFDPITPPSYGALAAQTLVRSQSVVLTEEAHGSSTSPCGERILRDFLNDPSAAVDSTCAVEASISFDALKAPRALATLTFVTPDRRPPPDVVARLRRPSTFPFAPLATLAAHSAPVAPPACNNRSRSCKSRRICISKVPAKPL
jgi:pimeloyl-ACP methyl ester carboxylesterase